jgi:YVTN family beta-propeller protein
MMRAPLLLFGALVAATLAAAVTVAQTPADDRALVGEGENVFAASCGNQYCHGAGGKGAQGPRLAEYPMTPEHIRQTILEGRAGTPMVSFRGALEPRQIDAVVAYVLSISSGGRTTAPVAAAPAPGGRPVAPPPPQLANTPVLVGKGLGTPAAGLAAFFDPTTVASCRTCHSYARRGGPLGVDLALTRMTPAEVLASLGRPRVPSRAYPVITVTLADGTRLTGIRAAETAETLSVYDVFMPPVRRTFAKADVTNIEPGKQGVFDHTKLRYTPQQLRDIAAMIGTPPTAAVEATRTQPAAGTRAYVTNEFSGDLTIIDLAASKVAGQAPLGKRPRGIALSPDHRLLYIALSGSPVGGPGVDETKLPPPDKGADGIGVFDIAQNRLVRVLRGVSDPENVAVSPRGDRLYVASEDTGQLVALDAASGRVVAKAPVGDEPEGVRLSPDGSLVLVTSEAGDSVAVVDARSLEVLRRVRVGQRPRSLLFLGGRAYVQGEADASLTAFDPADGRQTWRVTFDGENVRPMGLAAANGALYVTTGRGGELLRVDPANGAVTGRVRVGERPWGLAATPDGRLVLTANGPSNDVALVDATSMKVVARYPAGNRPWGVVVQ